MSNCPGADGLMCIDGWLYASINMMIFSANKKCPACSEVESEPVPDKQEQDDG